MLAFISCAKTMAARCTLRVPQLTTPRFEAEGVAERPQPVAILRRRTGDPAAGQREDSRRKPPALPRLLLGRKPSDARHRSLYGGGVQTHRAA